MFQKNISNTESKGISKQIKKRFLDVLDSLQIQIRKHNINRSQQLQKIQNQVKLMSQKVNEFSNLLLQDNFKFSTLEDHPILMIKYCQIMFQILIDNFHSYQNNQLHQNVNIDKKFNQNNIYEVVAAVKLENFDLKQKVNTLEQQLELAKKRAGIAESILQKIQTNTEKFLDQYKVNFTTMCDLLKKAQSNETQLLQNNRFLKEQLQSLTIQFDRYKQYYKQGPSLKDKQDKMRYQFQRQYEEKLKNTIKQVQSSIKSQLQRSIIEKFNVKNVKQVRVK